MKKLLIFVMALTFMAQASVSFAETIWDSANLANKFGLQAYNLFDGFNDGVYGQNTHGYQWGKDYGSLGCNNGVFLQDNQVGQIVGRIPVELWSPTLNLRNADYRINISFHQNTGISSMTGVMHIDRVVDGNLNYFLIDSTNFDAFSKTFVVDGIEYETRLSAPTLTGAELAWAQNYLGVGSDVTIFGWTTVPATRYELGFYLDIGATGNSAVPVPAAVWLMGTGVAGLVALKRRNSAK